MRDRLSNRIQLTADGRRVEPGTQQTHCRQYRLDVAVVLEALGRQVRRFDVVELLRGNRESRFGAGTA